MTAEQVAATIEEEFNLFCGVFTGHGGSPYYLWNAPHGVYDAELRDLRKRIQRRIEELEQIEAE